MFWLQKLDDGSITAKEFFKLFNIDFVIHNPRQSILPRGVGSTSFILKYTYINIYIYEKQLQNLLMWLLILFLQPDTDRTQMDLLKDRHIIRPKQIVYETDVLNLTEQVEGYVPVIV